jgi:hypothetical protein
MRSKVVEATVRALRRAVTSLPEWVLQRIRDASEQKTSPVVKSSRKSSQNSDLTRGGYKIALQDVVNEDAIARRSQKEGFLEILVKPLISLLQNPQ